MKSIALCALALTFAPTSLTAQTPTPWPLGCWIPMTIANNGTTTLPYTPCYPIVTDAQGNFVSVGLCLQVIVMLAPGETRTVHWGQYDFTGTPVPPGLYFVNGEPFQIGAADAAVRMHGSPHPGSSRNVEVCAAGQANLPFVLAASFSANNGIPLGCGKTFPLDADLLLDASLNNTTLFSDFVGVLDDDGRSETSAINLPPIPGLVGIPFHLAALTLDATASCGIGTISPPTAVVIE